MLKPNAKGSSISSLKLNPNSPQILTNAMTPSMNKTMPTPVSFVDFLIKTNSKSKMTIMVGSQNMTPYKRDKKKTPTISPKKIWSVPASLNSVKKIRKIGAANGTNNVLSMTLLLLISIYSIFFNITKVLEIIESSG